MDTLKTNITNINKKLVTTDFSQFFKLLYAKKFFFMLILINLLIQIAIIYYVYKNFDRLELAKNRKLRRLFINGSHVLHLGIIIILDVVPMPIWLKLILFSIFSITLGIMLEDIKLIVKEDTIKIAFIASISIFALLFSFGLALIKSNIILNYKFSLGLFFVLVVLLISFIIQYFIYSSSILKKTLLGFALLLFSVYVIYATNMILQDNYGSDFITASLDYFLIIFNICVALLYYTIMKLFYSVKNSLK